MSKHSDAKNVDVYTGALSEPPLDGAIAGPVLNCLITDQFTRLKRGDSHWYERRTGPQRFTDGMLLELNRAFETFYSIYKRNQLYRSTGTNIWNIIGSNIMP